MNKSFINHSFKDFLTTSEMDLVSPVGELFYSIKKFNLETFDYAHLSFYKHIFCIMAKSLNLVSSDHKTLLHRILPIISIQMTRNNV